MPNYTPRALEMHPRRTRTGATGGTVGLGQIVRVPAVMAFVRTNNLSQDVRTTRTDQVFIYFK